MILYFSNRKVTNIPVHEWRSLWIWDNVLVWTPCLMKSAVLIHKLWCGSQTVSAQLFVPLLSQHTETGSWPQRQIFAVCQISPLPSLDITVAITISKPQCPLLLQTQQTFPHTLYTEKEMELNGTLGYVLYGYHPKNILPEDITNISISPLYTEHQVIPNIILLAQSNQQSTLDMPTVKQNYDPSAHQLQSSPTCL